MIIKKNPETNIAKAAAKGALKGASSSGGIIGSSVRAGNAAMKIGVGLKNEGNKAAQQKLTAQQKNKADLNAFKRQAAQRQLASKKIQSAYNKREKEINKENKRRVQLPNSSSAHRTAMKNIKNGKREAIKQKLTKPNFHGLD